MDTSLLLSEDDALLFGSYIGILQWAVELARIDLTQLVLLMARFQNAPHEGHMAAVLCIFGYVKGHLKAKIVFDLLYCDWMAINWQDNVDWKEFYLDAQEPISPKAPELLGNEVQINIYCDAAHVTCLAMH